MTKPILTAGCVCLLVVVGSPMRQTIADWPPASVTVAPTAPAGGISRQPAHLSRPVAVAFLADDPPARSEKPATRPPAKPSVPTAKPRVDDAFNAFVQRITDAKLEPLDLTKYYHAPASGFSKNETYPWRVVPRGRLTLGNVPLDIGGMICLYGEANAKRGQVFAKKLEGIRVGRKFESLYLYHATFHQSAEGAPVVKLVCQYADGNSFEKEICYGTHVRDWYRSPRDPDEMGDPRSARVWTGVNPMTITNPPPLLQFFITEIANPHPQREIAAIDLFSVDSSNSASCILAMTTGPAGMLKVDPKALDEELIEQAQDKPTSSPKSTASNEQAYREFAGRFTAEESNVNGSQMKFIWCPPGRFAMGAIQIVDGKLINDDQANDDPFKQLRRQNALIQRRRQLDPQPKDADGGQNPAESKTPDPPDQTLVHFLRGYWLGKYEVTRSEWNQFMDSRPWENRDLAPQGDDFPATYIAWSNAFEFCRRFTEHERQAGRLPDGWEYTLPTEAQWERACRAKTTTRFSFGDDASLVQDYAWVDENTSQRNEPYPHRVGQKRPNPWGLHDMHGNVSEWCQDWYATLPGGRDPVVTAAGGLGKVRRGGSFRESQCGSAARYAAGIEVRRMEFGFRVACRFVEADK